MKKPKPQPNPLPEKTIPMLLYSFFAEYGILSSLGMRHRERRDLMQICLGNKYWHFSEQANEELKAFLDKYLTCLKGS